MLRSSILISMSLVALTACKPRSAELSNGQFTAFLNKDNSFNLVKESINLEKYTPSTDGSTVNCTGGDCIWGLDCRTFEFQIQQLNKEREENALRCAAGQKEYCALPKTELTDNAIENLIRTNRAENNLDDICTTADGTLTEPGVNFFADPPVFGEIKVGGKTEEVPFPPVHEQWMEEGGFVVLQEKLDPWRGEAIITSEGDLQIGFHHFIKGGGDFRFAFVIDPVFEPTTCVLDSCIEEFIDSDGNGKYDDGEEFYDCGCDTVCPPGERPNGNPDPGYVEPDENEGNGVYDSIPGTSTVRQQVDRHNWIDRWSDDLAALDEQEVEGYDTPPILEGHTKPGTRLFFLNARSYQLDPTRPEDNTWSLPNEWRAGFTEAKFGEEFFHNRTARYGEPFMYAAVDNGDLALDDPGPVWYCGDRTGHWLNGEPVAPGGPDRWSHLNADNPPVSEDKGCDALIGHVQRTAAQIEREWAMVGVEYQPLVHSNSWRKPEYIARPEGLDEWVEMHFSYVVIDPGSNIEVGGNVSGAFAIVLEADESNGRIVLQGEFSSDKIKRERWTTDDVHTIKLIENGTTLCGGKKVTK